MTMQLFLNSIVFLLLAVGTHVTTADDDGNGNGNDDMLGTGTVQVSSYADLCSDAGITSVEECGTVADTVCQEEEGLAVADKYMATFSYENKDDTEGGPKYCVVRCIQGGTRYEICGAADRDKENEEDDSFSEEDKKGWGCYDQNEHQCSCTPDVCTEVMCSSQEGDHSWTESCASCQCGDDALEDDDDPLGVGSVQSESYADMCDDVGITTVEECGTTADELCTAYENVDNIYMATFSDEDPERKGGPKYCVVRCVEGGHRYEICGLAGRGDDGDGESDTKHDHEGHAGYGCFNRAEHQCSCEPEVCSEKACIAQNEEEEDHFYLSDNCSSCQCVDSTVMATDDNYEEYCLDSDSIDSIDSCGDAGTQFCTVTMGFNDKYMTTYANEHGDCGNKYCTVRCEEWGTRYQLCGESGRVPDTPDDCDPDEESSSDATGHEHAGPVGYGCLNRKEHQCMCEPENCDEQTCVAQENYWSDNCSSCQCSSKDVTIMAPNNNYEEYCADTTIDSVEECGGAGTDFCMEMGYEQPMYITTYSNEDGNCGAKYCTVRCEDGGTKYQLCGVRGRESSDPNESKCEPDSSDDTGHVRGNPVGYGCYDKTEHQCVCDPEVCSEVTCLAQGEDLHSWSDNCGSCQCANYVDSSEGSSTVTDVVCSEDNYSTLCSLLNSCPSIFDDDGTYTLFAPTNDAFSALNDIIPLNSVSVETICAVLMFHASDEGAMYSDDLSCEGGDASLIGMMNDKNARIKCAKEVPYGIKGGGNVEVANFVAIDIKATNGVVHGIDTVLFFPRVINPNEGIVAPSFRTVP